MKTGLWIALAMFTSGVASAAVSDGRPAVGRHAAQLCVTTAAAVPSCGPAQVDLRRDGSARVRVDDVVYRLQLHSSQVDVVLKHGAMQIDGFTAPYEWKGSALHFVDADKGVRYEVQFDKRRP